MATCSGQCRLDSRPSIKARPGKLEKFDYEYKRKETCNIFVAIAPKAGKRIVKVTDTRTKQDYAYFVEELIEKHFYKATCIQLVLDNLNTHFPGSLIETFGKRKAARLQKRSNSFIHPNIGSWLNMAEIEINVMDRQCTGGRIESHEKLKTDLGHWSKGRNLNKKDIGWKFTRQDADIKLSKNYVA